MFKQVAQGSITLIDSSGHVDQFIDLSKRQLGLSNLFPQGLQFYVEIGVVGFDR